MMQLPFRARIFILGVGLISLLALAAYSRSLPSQVREMVGKEGVVVISVALFAVLAEYLRGHPLFYRIELTMSTACLFGVMLISGPAIACWIALFVSVMGDMMHREGKKAWYKIVFNAANFVVCIALGGFLYNLINDGNTIPLSSPRNFIAILVAGIVYLLLNIGLVCTAVAFAQRHRFLDVYREHLPDLEMQLIMLIPLGILIAMIYCAGGSFLFGLFLLAAFPVLLERYFSRQYQNLHDEYRGTVERIAQLVDERDHYTSLHSQKVAEYSEEIARKLGLDRNDTKVVVGAALIHDLGKIGSPINVYVISESGAVLDVEFRDILKKPMGLTDEEWRKIQEHPSKGADVVRDLPFYGDVRELVEYHQERYDGKGYPAGLKGEEIPLGARILAVADAYDAMTSDRPYRRAMSHEKAVAELEAGKGTQFDPKIVEAFLTAMEEERQGARAAKPDLLARSHGDLS